MPSSSSSSSSSSLPLSSSSSLSPSSSSSSSSSSSRSTPKARFAQPPSSSLSSRDRSLAPRSASCGPIRTVQKKNDLRSPICGPVKTIQKQKADYNALLVASLMPHQAQCIGWRPRLHARCTHLAVAGSEHCSSCKRQENDAPARAVKRQAALQAKKEVAMMKAAMKALSTLQSSAADARTRRQTFQEVVAPQLEAVKAHVDVLKTDVTTPPEVHRLTELDDDDVSLGDDDTYESEDSEHESDHEFIDSEHDDESDDGDDDDDNNNNGKMGD